LAGPAHAGGRTAFIVRGEPIVCSLDDAYRCFMRTGLDVLVLEQYVLLKTNQAAVAENDEWRQEFVLD
jgi:carbamoyltransferase